MSKWFGIAWSAALAGAIFGLFTILDTTRNEDAWLLLFIACTYALGVLVMLLGTTRWSLRGLGLLGTMSGDALLYGVSAMRVLGWVEVGAWFGNLVRACFLVGGILMMFGLLRWFWEQRSRDGDEAP